MSQVSGGWHPTSVQPRVFQITNKERICVPPHRFPLQQHLRPDNLDLSDQAMLPSCMLYVDEFVTPPSHALADQPAFRSARRQLFPAVHCGLRLDRHLGGGCLVASLLLTGYNNVIKIEENSLSACKLHAPTLGEKTLMGCCAPCYVTEGGRSIPSRFLE